MKDSAETRVLPYVWAAEEAARRAEAYGMHEEGWAAQMKSIERYLAKAA